MIGFTAPNDAVTVDALSVASVHVATAPTQEPVQWSKNRLEDGTATKGTIALLGETAEHGSAQPGQRSLSIEPDPDALADTA
jgi:hypothetical protein